MQTKWQQMVAALLSTKGQFIRKTLNWRAKRRRRKTQVIKIRYALKEKKQLLWLDVFNPLLFSLIDKGYQKEDLSDIRGIGNLRIKLNKAKLRDIMNLDSYEETPMFQVYVRWLMKWLHDELQKSIRKFQKSNCFIVQTLQSQVIKTIKL